MKLLQETLCALKLNEGVAYRNLTLFPLCGADTGAADYLTLDEALAQKVARITEISDSGSVPELRLENRGDLPVFLMDGEELVGAKQNRTLNISILAPAHSTLFLPVTCVEAGRWSSVSAEFDVVPRAHYARARAFKHSAVTRSLHTEGVPQADQGEVWQDIEEKFVAMCAYSPTHAMAAMYEQHQTGVEAFQAAFSAQEGQRGAIFAIGGEIIGGDLFESAATFRKLLPKLVASYALDALDAPSEPEGRIVAPEAAERFLSEIGQAETETFTARGLGEDVRLHAAGLAGGALMVEERLIHLSAFAIREAQEAAPADVNVSRASTRRFHWRQDR